MRSEIPLQKYTNLRSYISIIGIFLLQASCTLQLTIQSLDSSSKISENPSTLTVIELGFDEANLSWTGPANAQYRLAFKEGPTAPVDCSTDTVIDLSNDNYRMTGLSPDTKYS